MSLPAAPVAGTYLRVADPDWADPLDPSFAAIAPGQRWNPAGLPCLYLNGDEPTARANVRRRFVGLPYGPEDLDPATAPILVHVELPPGRAADAFSDHGLARLGLPATFPLDTDGDVVAHEVCRPIGRAAFDAGLDGVDARSAAPGGTRELAWYPRDVAVEVLRRQAFDDWW